MKLISWNVRGLGGIEKRKEVSQLVREKRPFIFCIQETKCVSFDDLLCKSIWGDANVGYSIQPSLGASGGLVTLWDSSEVEVWSTTSFDHVLMIIGRFSKSNDHFVVLNIYAPCYVSRQRSLWDNISTRLVNYDDENLCICGDFNAVRNVSERRSVGCIQRHLGTTGLNQFIDDNLLIDLPLRGRNFTWYKGDGKSMSRIDRFLLSEKWCLTLPNCFQLATARGLSDHCPLVLSIDEENWGLRPLRLLKCWANFPGYKTFVRDQWRSFQLEGYGGYVLKEKFKLIKLALRDSHIRQSQNLPRKFLSLKEKISSFDLKRETEDLLESKLEEYHGLSEDLFSLAWSHASICWQQSRALWLREGDANSKKIHGIMSSRRRGNAVTCFLVDNVLIEGVDNVRKAVFSHFSTHFQASFAQLPSIEGLQFSLLSHREGASLVKPFSVEEVKNAVWDCDNYKCPGPDGITFGFIKDFWDILRDDVMHFLGEFHMNGRLTKGINSTFIALIPKVESPQRLNDFRPISLVGSMYKILAKVLANRIRSIIGSIISDS